MYSPPSVSVKCAGSVDIRSWSHSLTNLRVAPAVHAQDLACDVSGFLRDQECACGGDVFGLAHAAHRCPVDGVLDVAEPAKCLGFAQHGCIDEARGYRVDGDAGWSVFERQ